MTPSELLLEGVELMLFGLGTVFLFLILLVLMIRVMSWVIEHFAAKTPIPVSVPSAVKPASDEPSADVLAAIQSAIHQHRARRG
ncbi:MAG: OadG family transporter subunit [Pseudomonas sp.]|uniref:OadG family protein n=1 Tax=Pseudomonas sp. TaxID=306 RepID=UPI002724186E|nr:OadG family transporter subunit [Pseudomonas sp.]MDO9618410.1 OadG family transporter subunit [Pseudomonas sp.]MDP2445395.1 OadG family transporter subunit [Pseudomonas sp.]MDZ4334700.1 OadG family transporter subunit [Pseudomonas sp.]